MKTHNYSLPPIKECNLSAAAIAERWSCSAMTVKRRIKSGELRAQKNGRLVRVSLSEVIRYELETTI